jgi:hypothetical protein
VISIKCRREKVEKNILGWNNNMRAQVEKAKHPNSTELANSCIFFEKTFAAFALILSGVPGVLRDGRQSDYCDYCCNLLIQLC